MKRKVNVESANSVSKKVKPAEPNLKLIRPSEVPVYLHDSVFYKSLDIDDDDEFLLPSNLMKSNTDVESLDDLSELLNTIRQWGVDKLPNTIVEFCLTQNLGSIKRVLCGVKNQFVVMQALLIVLDDKFETTSRMEAAMECGDIRLVQYVEKQSDATEQIYTTRALALAAENGNSECLEHALHRTDRFAFSTVLDGHLHQFYSPHASNKYEVYMGAVRNGHLPCVELLYQHHFWFNSRAKLTEQAAKNGHLECLKFLQEHGMKLYHCGSAAASTGQLACLQYVMDQAVGLRDHSNWHFVCAAAAEGGHLQCLQYVHALGCPWDASKMCVLAAAAGSVSCLQYTHQNGCAMTLDVGMRAVEAGSGECLQYYLTNGGERSYEICYTAALNGHLACLQYAHTHGCPLTKDSPGSAALLVATTARKEHWDCVQYLIEHNCPLTRSLHTKLSNAGQTDLLHLAEQHSHTLK